MKKKKKILLRSNSRYRSLQIKRKPDNPSVAAQKSLLNLPPLQKVKKKIFSPSAEIWNGEFALQATKNLLPRLIFAALWGGDFPKNKLLLLSPFPPDWHVLPRANQSARAVIVTRFQLIGGPCNRSYVHFSFRCRSWQLLLLLPLRVTSSTL